MDKIVNTHSLMAHLPAALLVALILAAFGWAWPFPDPAPVHFGSHGLPDRWGAPWEVPLIILLVTAITIGLSVTVDNAWSQQELCKRFNWLSLLDELVLSVLAATAIQYALALDHRLYEFHYSWVLTIALAAASCSMAAIAEYRRSFSRRRIPPRILEDTQQIEREVSSRQVSGHTWAYWDTQNPRYVKWYLPIFGVGMMILGLTSWGENRWAASLAFFGGLLVLAVIAGGFRTRVTPTTVSLRAGLFGIPLLTVRHTEIDEVKVHTFSPLADFGGYGIRRNRRMLAFFLQGEQGVRLITRQGKQYLLGSDRPQRLAAVIRAAVNTPVAS
jgi:hypothetical protein